MKSSVRPNFIPARKADVARFHLTLKKLLIQMKTARILPFTLAMMIAGVLYGQGLHVSTYAEQTKLSTKLGTAIGFNLPYDFAVGGFYQQRMQSLPDEPRLRYTEEWEFFGLYGSGRVFTSQYFEIDAMVRMGVTNRENFAISPSFIGTYRPAKRIEFNMGMGVRCFNPTLIGGVTINLN
jgi:hypothetical protein